jgi:hypothetical protein
MNNDDYISALRDIIVWCNVTIVNQAAEIVRLNDELARCRQDWQDGQASEASND